MKQLAQSCNSNSHLSVEVDDVLVIMMFSAQWFIFSNCSDLRVSRASTPLFLVNPGAAEWLGPCLLLSMFAKVSSTQQSFNKLMSECNWRCNFEPLSHCIKWCFSSVIILYNYQKLKRKQSKIWSGSSHQIFGFQLLGICPKNSVPQRCQLICVIDALLTIARTWKRPQCLPTGGWIMKI